MAKGKVLIVEDDKNIAKLVKYNLEKEGFSCSTVITGEDAMEYLDREPVDIIILDVMLPKIDGFEVCRRIRRIPSLAQIPVLILTAKGEEIDRVLGFELGADDYVVKPFSPRELILRLKNLLKRGRPEEESKDIFNVDRLTVDISRHKVIVDKKSISLTAMEFKLLVTLIKTKGRVQSRERLLDNVWNMAAEVTTRTVDTHIKRLRQKLGKTGKLIETVRGVGYRLSEREE
ncbi:MAG: response regulator transcription factor [Candidatus Omnitrophota bacterium]